MKKILVVNGPNYAKPLHDFGEIVFDPHQLFQHPEEFILVQFTGGEDVSPELYGDTSPLGYCHNNTHRDKTERFIFDIAYENGIKMAGICRGSQFINVMSGGRMMHHIEHHAGERHKMRTLTGEIVEVNSSHHQMSVLGPDGILFGWSDPKRSDVYIGRNDKPEEAPEKETEAFYYPGTRCVGVQYHPEWLDSTHEGFIFYKNLIDNFLHSDSENFKRYIGAGELSGSHGV